MLTRWTVSGVLLIGKAANSLMWGTSQIPKFTYIQLELMYVLPENVLYIYTTCVEELDHHRY